MVYKIIVYQIINTLKTLNAKSKVRVEKIADDVEWIVDW